MKKLTLYSIEVALMLGAAFILTAFVTDKKQKEKPAEIIKTNINGTGIKLTLEFEPGKYHNHPTLAVWLEDVNGNFIQELYVTKSLATGIYGHASKTDKIWDNQPGEARRPATLPYFLHKRNIKAHDGTYLPTPDNPIADAFTGATPLAGFKLQTKSDSILKGKFVLLCEVNQPWDWNQYWNNTLYQDDFDYKTSCQPALVYAVTIDMNNLMEQYFLNPIGHSHYSGKDGRLYTDISTLTTAKQIFKSIKVKLN